MEDLEEQILQGRAGQSSGRHKPVILTAVDAKKSSAHGRTGIPSGRSSADIMTVMDKLWGQGT